MSLKPNRRLRVGIAGLGFGASVHAPALLSLPSVEVVGLAGRSVEKAQAIANNLGITKGCGSVADLLDLGLDAITLALPPSHVASSVEAALARKVAVLCEKPLATDASVSIGLARQAQGVTTAMDFIFAELDVFIRLKQLIDSGTLGQVRHANLLWLNESWAHRNLKWSWKSDSDQCGGVISLFGTHVFYLSEWLFGAVKSVRAHLASSATPVFAPLGTNPAEDLVHCLFRHTSGVTLNCTFGNANPGITMHRWTVVSDGGTAVLENISSDYGAFTLSILRPNVAPELFFEASSGGDGRLKAFGKLAHRFMAAVQSGNPMQPDFYAGARVQSIASCVRESATTAKTIHF